MINTIRGFMPRSLQTSQKTQYEPDRRVPLATVLCLFLLVFHFAPILTPPVYAVALTGVTAIPWSSDISASTRHTIKFTTTTSLPADGKIVITYPSGFDVSSATFDSSSGFDGGKSIDIVGQVLTVTRDGDGSAAGAGAKYIVLDNITNHASTGLSYTVTVETQDSGGGTLDGSTTSANFATTGTADGLDTTAPWPKAGSNYRSNRQGSYAGPSYPTVRWTYGSGYDDSHTSAVQDADGNLYLGGNRMISLTADGSLRWETSVVVGGRVYYPTLGKGNVVYYLDNTQLKALNTDDGSEVWSYNVTDSDDYNNGPVIGPDGTIYVLGRSKQYAINSDGTLKWKTTGLDARMGPSAAVDPDSGNLAISGESGGALKLAYPDGRKYGNTGGAGITKTSAMAVDGSVYVSGRNAGNGVYAINADGTLKWYYAGLGGGALGGLSADDSLFFLNSGSNLYALDTTGGSVTWGPTAFGGTTWTADLAVDPFNDVIYAGNYAINQSDGSFKWKYTGLGNCDFPTIGLDNTLYCLQHYSTTNSVFALDEWTLSATLGSTTHKPGDTITITATSSMLRQDPAAGVDNQVQVVMANGDKLLLSYASTAGDETTWTGTYTVPDDAATGDYTAAVEAIAYKVTTDLATDFDSLPTGFNNTGITATVSYTIDANAPSLALTPISPDPTNNSPVQITGVTEDGQETISRVEVQLDATSGSWTSCTADDGAFDEADESFTCPVTSPLADGIHTVYVRVFDAVGNSNSASDTWRVDTAGPARPGSTVQVRDAENGSDYEKAFTPQSVTDLSSVGDNDLPAFCFTKAYDSRGGEDIRGYTVRVDGKDYIGDIAYTPPSSEDHNARWDGDAVVTKDYERYTVRYSNFARPRETQEVCVWGRLDELRLTPGFHTWSVKAHDTAGNSAETETRRFLVKTSIGSYAPDLTAWFPLVVLQIGNRTEITDLTTLQPRTFDAETAPYTISTPNPIFYGIANTGTKVSITLEEIQKDNTTGEISRTAVGTNETTANAESRWGINFTPDIASLTPSATYYATVIATLEDKIALMQDIPVTVGTAAVLGVEDERETEVAPTSEKESQAPAGREQTSQTPTPTSTPRPVTPPETPWGVVRNWVQSLF